MCESAYLGVRGAQTTFATKRDSLKEQIGILTQRKSENGRVVAGLRDSLQLAAIGRIGRDGNKGSIQLDLTYPLTTLLKGNMDLSLDAQYFYGYGDTLLTYNQRSSIFRFGLALVR